MPKKTDRIIAQSALTPCSVEIKLHPLAFSTINHASLPLAKPFHSRLVIIPSEFLLALRIKQRYLVDTVLISFMTAPICRILGIEYVIWGRDWFRLWRH